jgi:hypothetical protein
MRLISIVVATAIAATATAVTATTTAAAKAATAAISTTAKRLVFLRLGFIHFDSTAFYRSAIQLGNRLAGSFIIGHFDKAESTGPARYFVHDYLGRSHFAIRRKEFPEIFILNGEAQICNINVHKKTKN